MINFSGVHQYIDNIDRLGGLIHLDLAHLIHRIYLEVWNDQLPSIIHPPDAKAHNPNVPHTGPSHQI
jgi:hypothetical protein